jgi:hypothetical protein
MGQIHKVIFAPQAIRDLEVIVLYICRHAGGETAEWELAWRNPALKF